LGRLARIDLRAAFLCARAAAPHMRRLRGGRIINFADWTPRSGRPRYTGLLPYYVAKAGIVALTEGLALELASDQILVNAIAPGPIVAPEGASDDEFAAVERATATRPLGRRRRDCEGRPCARRDGLRHGRNDSRRWRKTLEVRLQAGGDRREYP
jgi:NAD(P)-dependent dehydrogenase (short-subunit alcohol dehydrogenase family)